MILERKKKTRKQYPMFGPHLCCASRCFSSQLCSFPTQFMLHWWAPSAVSVGPASEPTMAARALRKVNKLLPPFSRNEFEPVIGRATWESRRCDSYAPPKRHSNTRAEVNSIEFLRRVRVTLTTCIWKFSNNSSDDSIDR